MSVTLFEEGGRGLVDATDSLRPLMVMVIVPPANVCSVPGKHRALFTQEGSTTWRPRQKTKATGVASNHVEVIRVFSVILPLAARNCFAYTTVRVDGPSLPLPCSLTCDTSENREKTKHILV